MFDRISLRSPFVTKSRTDSDDSLLTGINELFDELLKPASSGGSSNGVLYNSFCDKNQYTILVEAPGVPKEAVEIEVKQSTITIAIKHEFSPPSIRSKMEIVNAWKLRDDIDTSLIAAGLKDGILTVILPRIVPKPEEEEAPSKITVT